MNMMTYVVIFVALNEIVLGYRWLITRQIGRVMIRSGIYFNQVLKMFLSNQIQHPAITLSMI